jgi:hypothetical protein
VGVADMPKSKKKALIVGLGLDSDGHKRLTTGPNFALLGGTEDTHAAMTEKAIKINEKLAARGKKLEDISREEFDDLVHSLGLRRRHPKPPDPNQKPNETGNEEGKEE